MKKLAKCKCGGKAEIALTYIPDPCGNDISCSYVRCSKCYFQSALWSHECRTQRKAEGLAARQWNKIMNG